MSPHGEEKPACCASLAAFIGVLVDSQPMGKERCMQITAVRAAAERKREQKRWRQTAKTNSRPTIITIHQRTEQ